jgi:pyruvate/2-oxoglutarate dehydrogenase complex dihydrolipoamide dehydrogenase (E3) component
MPKTMDPGFDFDCVVVGGGSGGYAAARTLSAAQWRVAVVDGGEEVGGLCILRGCMPTKALLHAAELRQAIHHAARWGIHTGPVTTDVPALFARKDALIREFADYRRQQLESGRFEFIRSQARFLDPHTLQLSSGNTLRARHFVVATGSVIAPLPLPDLETLDCLTSDTALRLREIPESLVVLGGGPVAVEFAQFFQRMGSRVTLLQRSPQLLRGTDPEAAVALQSALRREGMDLRLGCSLQSARRQGPMRTLHFVQDGKEHSVTAHAVFHGLGRRPATSDLGLDAAGVVLRPSGHIQTDLTQQTSTPHIYAAGDCCGPHEIVHVAIQQGELAAHHLLNPDNPRRRDDRLLVHVTFTDPAVAQVGWTEADARKAGVPVLCASYPFNDHGKSIILGAEEGFVKLVVRTDTREIVGGTCVGPQAGELIHEVVVAMAARMTAGQFASVPHYHPTLAEIWSYPAEELAG